MSNNEILKENNEKTENFENIKKSDNKPTGISVITREILKDKLALASLIILVILFGIIFIGNNDKFSFAPGISLLFLPGLHDIANINTKNIIVNFHFFIRNSPFPKIFILFFVLHQLPYLKPVQHNLCKAS